VRKFDFEELETREEFTLTHTSTAATDRFFALSNLTTDFKKIYSIVVIDGLSSHPVRKRSPRQWDKVAPRPEASPITNRPQFYVKFQKKIEWYPIPDQAYTMQFRGVKWPTKFTATSTTQSDLNEKDDLIISFALAYAYRRLGEYDRARRMMQDAKEELGEGIDEETYDPDLELKPLFENEVFPDYDKDPFIRRMP
jgi:hypothetical protein